MTWKPHIKIHLQLDPERDLNTYVKKRSNIYVLRTEHGGSYLGKNLDVAFCGMRPERVVRFDQRERFTCGHCKRLMLVRFPKKVNPRSGMAMPRPPYHVEVELPEEES